ncbi:MAG: hypothetical protein JXQ27_12115 [Acidobacteria bacterium]|nr:hypothetical protein [Acidobacteriota bacterium]
MVSHDGGVLRRRLVETAAGLVLQPENPEFSPVKFRRAEMEIMGRVVFTARSI